MPIPTLVQAVAAWAQSHCRAAAKMVSEEENDEEEEEEQEPEVLWTCLPCAASCPINYGPCYRTSCSQSCPSPPTRRCSHCKHCCTGCTFVTTSYYSVLLIT
jgi:hypothetical protein